GDRRDSLVTRGLSSSECLLEISGTIPPGSELKSPLESSGDNCSSATSGISSQVCTSLEKRRGFFSIPLSTLTVDRLRFSSGQSDLAFGESWSSLEIVSVGDILCFVGLLRRIESDEG